jgi:hypothetical protein
MIQQDISNNQIIEESNEIDANLTYQPRNNNAMNSSSFPNTITFSFSSGHQITYDMSLLFDISPVLFAKLQLLNNHETVLNVSLPEYITPQNLNDFICLVKNNTMMIDEHNSRTQELINVLKTSEFFQNFTYSAKIINDLVLQVLTSENVFEYFDFCYYKIKALSQKKSSIEQVWFNFLNKCFEVIEQNFFLDGNVERRVLKFNFKIIEEIINRLIYKGIIGGIDINNVSFGKIINVIMFIRKQRSFFISAVNKNLIKQNDEFYTSSQGEYLNAFSSSNNHSAQGLFDDSKQSKPTIKIQIGKYELLYYYKEIEVELIEKEIFNLIFIVYYDNKRDELNISVKISDNVHSKRKFHLPLLSMSCNVILTYSPMKYNYTKHSQINVCNLLSTKNPLTQLDKIKNIARTLGITNNSAFAKQKSFTVFSLIPHKARLSNSGIIQSTNEIDSMTPNYSDWLTLTVYLRVNFIHSVLLSAIVKNFPHIYDDKNIEKLEHSMFTSIMLNKHLNKTNEDECVIAVINWSKFIY